MIWTYSPDDPSLFSATDEAPRNALGLVGASLADPLHRALGWASYGIAVALARLGRCASCCTPARPAPSAAPIVDAGGAPRRRRPSPRPTCRSPSWVHDYGLGGLLGDAALGALLSLVAARPRARRCRIVALALARRLRRQRRLRPRRHLGRGRAASCASSARARSLLYAGAHGLTGRAVAGAAGGARAAREPGRRGARPPRRSPQLAPRRATDGAPLRPRACSAPPTTA